MTNKQAYAGLLERLVRKHPDTENGRGTGRPDKLDNPDGPEAAEAISSLLKRVGELEGVLREADTLICDRLSGCEDEDARIVVMGIRAALNSDAPLSIGEGL